MFERHATSVLPDDVKGLESSTFLSAATSRLSGFHQATLRQRLAADLEIRLRSVYDDRMEKQDAEAIIRDIYRHVLSLEDMQFLVKYASQILPATANEAKDGAAVAGVLAALQSDLIDKRKVRRVAVMTRNSSCKHSNEFSGQNAVACLAKSMGHLYPETPNDQVT